MMNSEIANRPLPDDVWSGHPGHRLKKSTIILLGWDCDMYQKISDFTVFNLFNDGQLKIKIVSTKKIYEKVTLRFEYVTKMYLFCLRVFYGRKKCRF